MVADYRRPARKLLWIVALSVPVVGCGLLGGQTTTITETVGGPAPLATSSLGDTGQHSDLIVIDSETISGQVDGILMVGAGGTVTLNGQVTGDLIVEKGGRAQVLGMVIGDVVNRGEVTVYGTVDGKIVDEAGGHTILVTGAIVGGSPVP